MANFVRRMKETEAGLEHRTEAEAGVVGGNRPVALECEASGGGGGSGEVWSGRWGDGGCPVAKDAGRGG
ncbi:hypothetical protein NL676_028162 [Syzygium grande]|nr:hypothetical protein NL676_028162 [Syzygium grande]